jgi:hypothetical protein
MSGRSMSILLPITIIVKGGAMPYDYLRIVKTFLLTASTVCRQSNTIGVKVETVTWHHEYNARSPRGQRHKSSTSSSCSDFPSYISLLCIQQRTLLHFIQCFIYKHLRATPRIAAGGREVSPDRVGKVPTKPSYIESSNSRVQIIRRSAPTLCPMKE